LGGGYILLRY